jgi:hypothetical protein
MNQGTSTAEPLVSLIVPVYNSVTYLPETLDSLLEQGLSEDQLEVVIVDDGSDDGSETMVDEYAQRHRNFRVIHQEQSGGPATPCNVGVEAARGRYFFILGSDDVLTRNALRDLSAVAEQEGSDVVLAKLGSIGGRRTPGTVFQKTVLDADLVDHRIFNTLSAVKLFRTELARRTGAHHPPSLRIGSDQPFVAALYLAASKFSICADRDYVMIRTRDDGTNVTSRPRSPREYMDLFNLLVPVIVEGTEPGRVRDGVMRRPLRGTLTKVFKPHFLDQSQETQEQLLEDVRRVAGPVVNEVTAGHLDPLPRTKIELALDGDLEALRSVIEWERSSGTPLPLVHDGDRFTFDLPAEVRQCVGENRLHSPAVTGRVTLTEVTSTPGAVELDFMALVRGSRTAAEKTVLRMSSRSSDQVVDVPVTVERDVAAEDGAGHQVRARVDLAEYPLGVWDPFVVQHFGGEEVSTRLGADRAGTALGTPEYLFSGSGDHLLGKLYYTRFGNLSVDLGFTHTKNELPEMSVNGVLESADGSQTAIVTVHSTATPEFTLIAATEQKETLESTGLPFRKLGAATFAVALPVPSPQTTSRRQLRVDSGDGKAVATLPAAKPAPVLPRPADPRAMQEERSADILRRATGELKVVGRRAARRARSEVGGRFRPARGAGSDRKGQ